MPIRIPGNTVVLAGLLVMAASAGCRLERLEDAAPPAATAPALQVPAPVQRVAFRIPTEAEMNDTLRASVLRGRALLRHTRDSLPGHVGNRLQCVSCHPDDGTRRDVMPWIGVYARFPQYRARAGGTQIIDDRINDCFKRSMNGRPLTPEGRDMRDILAYLAFLSTGYPIGAQVDGQSFPRLAPLDGDTVRGRETWAAKCAACHAPDGAGTDVAPPTWGPHSYTIGAGMARVRTAAAFIRQAMPQNAPGSLTDQEAFDLAAYINTRPRPDFPGKELDWPNGDPPPDVAYPTRAAAQRAREAARQPDR
jgi:thiosulfate dehydrogenase